jgi:hypothetical protein
MICVCFHLIILVSLRYTRVKKESYLVYFKTFITIFRVNSNDSLGLKESAWNDFVLKGKGDLLRNQTNRLEKSQLRHARRNSRNSKTRSPLILK